MTDEQQRIVDAWYTSRYETMRAVHGVDLADHLAHYEGRLDSMLPIIAEATRRACIQIRQDRGLPVPEALRRVIFC